jgi:arylsulfatase A-like enzyme
MIKANIYPSSLTRRGFLASSGAALTAACAHARKTKSSNTRPNIIFIMADDLGYADLSCYGRRDYQTPNLDRLATQGVRYLDAYSNSAVCSATRTALITGQYQYRLPVGLEEPLASRPVGLPPAHPTLPSLLKGAGYRTALVGKWHLGRLPDYGPLQSGYDHFWGFRSGGIDYFTHQGPGGHDLWDQDIAVEAEGYLTDLLGNRALTMVDAFAASMDPFFLSLHFSAPHWPWEGPEDEAEATRIASDPGSSIVHFDGGSMTTYAAMVRRMDFQIGRLMDRLRELRLEENTIIVFTSDNGGERFSDIWPFSGRKTELLEGGIRVPCIARWPAGLPAGGENHMPCMSMDWAPTLLAACGVVLPLTGANFDGIDIFTDRTGSANFKRTLFWRMKWMAQEASRRGKWKYLKIGENRFLFDLSSDPMERANLKAREPVQFASMEAEYRAWERKMLPLSSASESHGFVSSQIADRYDPPGP